MQGGLPERLGDGFDSLSPSTPFFIRSEVGVLRVMFLDHLYWLDPKHNTRNIYLQMDDKRCKEGGSLAHF